MVTASDVRKATPVRTVGVVGGGQLGRMMAEAAPALGLELDVLDPLADCPAAEFARRVVVADFNDGVALAELAAAVDVVTLEIEAVDAAHLAALASGGAIVRPGAEVLATIQDKLVQKRFLADLDIPTSPFAEFDRAQPPAAPFVWKARRFGYDGRGVQIVRTAAASAALPDQPALAEDLVEIERELALMVARGTDGATAVYPLVDLEFNEAANILDLVTVPARVPAAVAADCRGFAERIVAALDCVGILGIEFFLTRGGELLVNELSPRPHNSGHYTIEACETSQFEQHLRAVAGLPLGSPRLLAPAVNFNILGAADARGVPTYAGIDEVAAAAGAAVHIYGKREIRPFRKMGHVTVTAPDLAEAQRRAAAARALVRASAVEEHHA